MGLVTLRGSNYPPSSPPRLPARLPFTFRFCRRSDRRFRVVLSVAQNLRYFHPTLLTPSPVPLETTALPQSMHYSVRRSGAHEPTTSLTAMGPALPTRGNHEWSCQSVTPRSAPFCSCGVYTGSPCGSVCKEKESAGVTPRHGSAR